MSKEKFVDSDQFVISYELLHLLHWIVKYESKMFKELITKSFLQGIEDSSGQNNGIYSQLMSSEDMHTSIVDFLNIAETHVAHLINSGPVKEVISKSMLPIINRVDVQSVDYETVKSSFLTAVEKGKIGPDSSASEQQFFKELLRQWKPSKKVKTVH
jgi:hypothetical protein